MNEKWNKYEYVCPNCDAYLTLVSVVDATISPITQKKEETMLDTPLSPAELYNPHQLVTYKKIAGTYALPEEPEYVTEKVTDIEWTLHHLRSSANALEKSYSREVELEELIKENYVESGDQSTLHQIAELFNIALTKDVEFIATIEISGTVTVDLTDEDALQNLLENNINVSSYDGDLDVSDYILVNYEER